MRLAFAPYLLHFRQPAGTSRGILTDKPTFLIKIYDEKDPERYGIGEAAVFPGLSPEADGNYVNKLLQLMSNVAIGLQTDLAGYSSIRFGLEQAILDFSNGCKGIYFDTPFVTSEKSIEINGLIWMGNHEEMLERIKEKLNDGFHCLKLKIGAIEWEKELELLRFIRNRYSEKDLIIRVDANGAFKPDEALNKLNQLASFSIHSIEQPVKAGNIEVMKKLCAESPVRIALDEELIGIEGADNKRKLLNYINPAYIILKPALCGGFSGGEEWISIAGHEEVGWWVTSALESNVGLNAIAQWVAAIKAKGTQGLGTGNLYTDNFMSPLYLKRDRLCYNSKKSYNYSEFENLHWHS